MKVYVASSWNNKFQPMYVEDLRTAGHEVYDFRNTKEGGGAFDWDQIDPNWECWDYHEFLQALKHPLSGEAFNNDLGALWWADAIVMIMKSGASSHMEVGIGVGMGKHTAIVMPEGGRPELMYKAVNLLTDNIGSVIQWLRKLEE
jgi:hypothetical protein